jgi:di- and tripeptidase
VADAAARLLEERALEVDVVMLIEGEEEAGSVGFQEAVQRNQVRGFSFLARDRGC